MKNMADYCNFPNPSFFGKFVKKHTGLSPMQYKLWLTSKVWGAMQKVWLIYKGKILNP